MKVEVWVTDEDGHVMGFRAKLLNIDNIAEDTLKIELVEPVTLLAFKLKR